MGTLLTFLDGVHGGDFITIFRQSISIIDCVLAD